MPALHTVWITGTPPLHVIDNLRKLSTWYKEQKDAFVPVLWMDSASMKNLANSVLDPKPVIVSSKDVPDDVYKDLKSELKPLSQQCQFLKITVDAKDSYVPVLQYENSAVQDMFKRDVDDSTYKRLTELVDFERDIANRDKGAIIALASDIIRLVGTMLIPGGYVDITDIPFTRLPEMKDVHYPTAKKSLGSDFVCHTQQPNAKTVLLENDVFFTSGAHVSHQILVNVAKELASAPEKTHAETQETFLTVLLNLQTEKQKEDFLKEYQQKLSSLNTKIIHNETISYNGQQKPIREILQKAKNENKLDEFYEQYLGSEGNIYRSRNEMVVNALGFEAYGNTLKRLYSEADLAKSWEKMEKSDFVDARKVTKTAYSWKSPGIALLEEIEYLTSINQDNPLFTAANRRYKTICQDEAADLRNDPSFLARQLSKQDGPGSVVRPHTVMFPAVSTKPQTPEENKKATLPRPGSSQNSE